MDDVKSSSTSDGMIKDLSAKFHAHKAHTLPCPPMVESPIIANALFYDKKLNQVMSYVKSCNKLFVNIALADESTCLYKLGYLSEADLQKLQASGAVGSICCRFFDGNGNTCDPEIDARTLGIGLEDIKKAECVMGCIVGANKPARSAARQKRAYWMCW
jgi:deoxyribonucleoside regulator